MATLIFTAAEISELYVAMLLRVSDLKKSISAVGSEDRFGLPEYVARCADDLAVAESVLEKLRYA